MEAGWFDVVIVGAGVSGIGAAWHVRHQLPETSFTILEARDAIGGTWDLFRYPGVRSDSDLHSYGYAFKPWTDDEAIASGSAILRYLEETIEENDLRPHIHFAHRVERISWSSRDMCWTVEARDGHGERHTFRCWWVLATTGYYRYDRGYQAELPGLEHFEGRVVHPQHWPADLDVRDRRVVVIGSGATAATLIPALAEHAGHVTMLQRSPSYYLSLPTKDPLANLARRFLSPERAYAWTRRKNVRTQALFYRLCRRYPERMKRVLVRAVAKQLPHGFDVDRHFTPRYGPWDQRVCITPHGDLFRAISSGRASVATGTIETFTERGVRLASGEEVPADIVVTATGLELLALGGMEVFVDGERMEPGDRVVYKGLMLSDVPNLAFMFGYTNASWTLKVDLACDWVCRCLAYMCAHGYRRAVPLTHDMWMPTAPMLDLASGYVERAAARMPRQGTGPWSLTMSYRMDEARLRRAPIEDGVLAFA